MDTVRYHEGRYAGIPLQWDRRRPGSLVNEEQGSLSPTEAAGQAGQHMARVVYSHQQQQTAARRPPPTAASGMQRRSGTTTQSGNTRQNPRVAPPSPSRDRRSRSQRQSSRASARTSAPATRIQEVDSLVNSQTQRRTTGTKLASGWNDDTNTAGLFDATLKSKQLFAPKRERRKSSGSREPGSTSGSPKRKTMYTAPVAAKTNLDRRANKPTNPWKRYQEIMQTGKKKHKPHARSGIKHSPAKREKSASRESRTNMSTNTSFSAENVSTVQDEEQSSKGRVQFKHDGKPDGLDQSNLPHQPEMQEKTTHPKRRIFPVSPSNDEPKVVAIPDIAEHIQHFSMHDQPKDYEFQEHSSTEKAHQPNPSINIPTASNSVPQSVDVKPKYSPERKKDNSRQKHPMRPSRGQTKTKKTSKQIEYCAAPSRLRDNVRDSQKLREILWSLKQAQEEEDNIAARILCSKATNESSNTSLMHNSGHIPLGIFDEALDEADRDELHANSPQFLQTDQPHERRKRSTTVETARNARYTIPKAVSSRNSNNWNSSPKVPSLEEIESCGRKFRKRQQLRYALLEGTKVNEFELHKTLADRLTRVLVRETCEEIDDYIRSIAEDTAFAV